MTCPDCGAKLLVKPELLACKTCGFTETDPSVELPGEPPRATPPSPELPVSILEWDASTLVRIVGTESQGRP